MADSSSLGTFSEIRAKLSAQSEKAPSLTGGTNIIRSKSTNRGQGISSEQGQITAPRKKPLPTPPRPDKKKDLSEIEEKQEQDVTYKRNSGIYVEAISPPVPPRMKKEEDKLPATCCSSRETATNITESKPSSVQYLTPIHPMSPDDDRVIMVTGFGKSVSSEALKLHFENHRKSGGGPVESVSITEGAAVVHFKQAQDAQNVLGKEQTFRNAQLTVVPYNSQKTNAKNMFLFSGLSDDTPEEMLRDFLESKTSCSVLDAKEYDQNGTVLVVFPEDSFPDLGQLQELCEKNSLDGSSLQVAVYNDEEVRDTSETITAGPMTVDTIQITVGRMKFIEMYEMEDLLKKMEKLHVKLKFDKKNYELTVVGREGHLPRGMSSMQRFLKDIRESESAIKMAGILDCLNSEEAKKKISSIESEEKCTIDVQDGTYAVIIEKSDSDRDSLDDSDGSFEGPSKNNSKATVMGEFQIGRCRFVMKKGTVDNEDSDCLVNITQSNITQGDLWRDLSDQIQEDLFKQARMGHNQLNWTKTGTITTSATGMDNKYILHVCQGYFKGDLVKTVNKCLQLANSMEHVSSVAFFSMRSRGTKDQSMEDSPSLLFEAINKYQQVKSNITTVNVVMDNMDKKFVLAVEAEVRKFQKQEQKKTGFFRGRLGQKSQDQTAIKVISGLPPTEDVQDIPVVASDREEDCTEEDEFIGADVKVFIDSHDEDKNLRALEKLNEFCQLKLPPRKLEDTRIKILTQKHIRRLRSRRVELDIDTQNGKAEIRGYEPDINKMCRKITKLLDKLQGKPETSDNGKPQDEDDIFIKFVASEIRAIPGEKQKRKVKFDIQKLLMDAHSKYLNK